MEYWGVGTGFIWLKMVPNADFIWTRRWILGSLKAKYFFTSVNISFSAKLLCRVMAQGSVARSFHVSPATAFQPNLPVPFLGSFPTANVAVFFRAFLLEPSPFFFTLRPASAESTSKFGFGTLTSKLCLGRHWDSGGVSSPWRCWGLCLGILCSKSAPPSILMYVWVETFQPASVFSFQAARRIIVKCWDYDSYIMCFFKLYVLMLSSVCLFQINWYSGFGFHEHIQWTSICATAEFDSQYSNSVEGGAE
jgi:hypothetical protein